MRVRRALVVGFVAALAAEHAQAQLLPAQLHPLNQPAGAPAAGDLDGDGRLDLAVANEATDAIAVFAGGAHFEFGTPVEWPAVEQPLGAAIADLDDDGLPELLAAGKPGGDIAVLLGLGGFSFAAPVPWSMAADATDFLVGDFDGDGREDVLTVGLASPDMILRLGDGSGGFGMPQSFAGASQAIDLVAVDLDVDGALDVLSAHSISFPGPTLQVHVNDGAGSLATTVDWTGPAYVWFGTVTPGDIDADGKPDVVGLTESLLPYWAAGDGTGAFGPAIALPSFLCCEAESNLALADMQGDAWLDLVATRDPEYIGNPCAEVLPGLGGGNFGLAASSRAITGSVLVADLDADTRPDVVVAGGEGVLALRGQGDGTFETVGHVDHQGLYAYPVGGAALADLNGDGWPDAALSSADEKLWWHLADGAGWFGPASGLNLGASANPVDLRACDLAGDGDEDLVVLDQGHASIWTLLGDGAGALAVGAELLLPGKPTALRLADITGDGLMDALLAREVAVGTTTGMFSLLPGLPDETLGSPQSLPLNGKPKDLDVADLDADGDLDVVVGTEFFAVSKLAVLRNDGAGILTAVAPPIEAGTQLTSLALADFDADGLVDVAVGGSLVLLLHGQAGDTFAPPEVIDPAPILIRDVTAGDVDGDGAPDLVLADLYSSVAVRFNDGDAGFAEVTWHPTLDLPVETFVQDFDLDGAADVLVADYNFGKGNESGLTILRNRSPSWAWTDLGHALAGTGSPHLEGSGALTTGTTLTVSLTGAAPLAPAVLFAGTSALLAPFKGGVFVPEPQWAVPFKLTDAAGALSEAGTCPAGLPTGFTVYFQYWIADAAGPLGWSASNGLAGETP